MYGLRFRLLNPEKFPKAQTRPYGIIQKAITSSEKNRKIIDFNTPSFFHVSVFHHNNTFGKLKSDGFNEFMDKKDNSFYFNNYTGDLYCVYLSHHKTYLTNDRKRYEIIDSKIVNSKIRIKNKKKQDRFEMRQDGCMLSNILPTDVLKLIEGYADEYQFHLVTFKYYEPYCSSCDFAGYSAQPDECDNCLSSLNRKDGLVFDFVDSYRIDSFSQFMNKFSDKVIKKLCETFEDEFRKNTDLDIWKEIAILIKNENL
jgi:hypothetical protein